MQKIKLDLDALTVASFETTDLDAGLRGTVQGQADTRTPYGPLADWAVSWLLACNAQQAKQVQ